MQGAAAPTASANQPLLQRGKPMRYTEVVRAAAGFLRRDDGPQVAVFDTTGWDTHANEGNAEGQLAGRLAALDAGFSGRQPLDEALAEYERVRNEETGEMREFPTSFELS